MQQILLYKEQKFINSETGKEENVTPSKIKLEDGDKCCAVKNWRTGKLEILEKFKESYYEHISFLGPPKLPLDGTISSYFGNRRNPLNGQPQFHDGIDIACPEYTIAQPLWDTDNIEYIQEIESHICTYTESFKVYLTHLDKDMKVIDSEYGNGPHLHLSFFYNDMPVNPYKVIAPLYRFNHG